MAALFDEQSPGSGIDTLSLPRTVYKGRAGTVTTISACATHPGYSCTGIQIAEELSIIEMG
jgi:hypothetical protein